MNKLKRIGIMTITAAVLIFGAQVNERLSITGAHSLIPSAEARIGRPLTPVSVAGVARRSVRRCAVGVYVC